MNPFSLKELRIGDLVASTPIIQGGMGVGISLSGLASAVANEGGIGVIATAGIGMSEPDFYKDFVGANSSALRREIRRARVLTRGIIGINVLVALSNFAELVTTAIEEEIDIVFSGAGLPLDLPKFLKGNKKTKLVPIVSSARAARVICRRWLEKYDYVPDAVVVEGPKAGGHLGFRPEQIDDPAFALESLVPQVIREIRAIENKCNTTIPVVAAGGLYTGEDILKFMHLGAAGVQMATRFVTTHECDASIEFKRSYIDCRKEDTVIIASPVGMPGRAIRNRFVDDIIEGRRKPFKCPYHCIRTCNCESSPYCIAMALTNAKKGRLHQGFAFAGANAYRASELISVHELMQSIAAEYEDAVIRSTANMQPIEELPSSR
ncbi:MAG: nitronate monooxygenase family protein [Dehalococcoidia bacterium]|nr:nitronate monooxygenase family protein [Dehalococcoidia bacterium]